MHNSAWRPGMIVRLLSGGPLMMVSSAEYSPSLEDVLLALVWMDKEGHLCKDVVRASLVTLQDLPNESFST